RACPGPFHQCGKGMPSYNCADLPIYSESGSYPGHTLIYEKNKRLNGVVLVKGRAASLQNGKDIVIRRLVFVCPSCKNSPHVVRDIGGDQFCMTPCSIDCLRPFEVQIFIL